MTETTQSAAANALDALGQAMLASVQPMIDAQIAKGMEEAKAKLGVRRIEIVTPDGVRKLDGHVNAIFDDVLRLVNSGLYPMIVGPAGSGKTHLSGQIAKALGLSYYAYSCSEGTTEASLFGRLLPIGEGGKFEYTSAPFVEFYEKGGIVTLDEFDAGNANVFTALNSALAQNHFFSDLRAATGGKAFVKKHEQFRAIACANTYGGGGSVQYAGRNQLDAATLDRFVLISMDYDRRFEEQIAPQNVCDFVWSLRTKIQEQNMRRVASTRMIVKMATMIEAGLSFRRSKELILSDWSKDDLIRVGA